MPGMDRDAGGSGAAEMGGMDVDHGADGASVRIVSPEEIHWHLYIDGESSGMISGLETELELEPGTYELAAVLASGDEHEEQETGTLEPIRVTIEP